MPEETRSGYGKNWLRWVLIYLVVGGIGYAIIYFAFLAGGDAGGGGGGGGGGY